MEKVKCKECGDCVCVCSYADYDELGDVLPDTEVWAAHCMGCDNTTGKKGCIDAKHETEIEAIEAWNSLNMVKK